MKQAFKYLAISSLLLGTFNLHAVQLPEDLNSNNGNASQSAPKTNDVKIDINQNTPSTITSTFQINGQDSTLETFSNYLIKFSDQPKTVDEDTNNFITHMTNSNPEHIDTVLQTIYSNNDDRRIPHPNQYKKQNDTVHLGLLKNASDYLFNANFDATGKTNKQVCEAVRSAKAKHAKFDKITISKYEWTSYTK